MVRRMYPTKPILYQALVTIGIQWPTQKGGMITHCVAQDGPEVLDYVSYEWRYMQD